MIPDDIIYLDHAATSWPKPPSVLYGITSFMNGVAANAGRSGHQAAVNSARMVYRVREKLTELFGIEDPSDLIFTRGTTEGLNLVLKGFLSDGDRVLISPLEHNSLMRPLVRLMAERGIEYDILLCDPYGRIEIAESKAIYGGGKYKLLCVNHASNVNGIVQDIKGIREAFPDTPLLIDAAQTAGVVPINAAEQGIDFLACSGHKGLLGPTGIGACYVSNKYDVTPLLEGGTGSKSESIVHPDFRPDRYESGTINLHGIAGLEGGLDYILANELGGEHKRELASILVDGLKGIGGVVMQTPDDGESLMVSFNIEGLYPDEVTLVLENDYGILCRQGLHCTPMSHKALGTEQYGSVRLAPGYGNTEEHIEKAIEGVRKIASGL